MGKWFNPFFYLGLVLMVPFWIITTGLQASGDTIHNFETILHNRRERRKGMRNERRKRTLERS